MSCGAPHFRSLAKRSRHSNYTFPKVLFELFDFPITKAQNIELKTQIDDTGKLQKIRVSDNYEFGFENIYQTGAQNPLNMGHTKDSHNDDLETSEFGTGMKSGSLSAANELRVITRVIMPNGEPKFFEVICDFIQMELEESVELSYNPMIREIAYSDYKHSHPFECGSTIILSSIRDSIYPRTSQEDITKDIISQLASTYDRLIRIRGVNIEVNRVKVEPAYDFFADPKCVPFIVTKSLWVIEKDFHRDYIVKRSVGKQETWSQYNRRENKWNKISDAADAEELINVSNTGKIMPYSAVNESGACLVLRTVFTFYSDKFHCGEDTELPSDALLIYKANRKYGKESLFDHRNGTHNYTLHEMDFLSKQLGKDIGITFNKDIQLNGKNELIMAIQSALEDNKSGITADTSTGANAKLCDKAIKSKVLDPETCPQAKLSIKHRSQAQVLKSSESDSESTTNSEVKPQRAKRQRLASSRVIQSKVSATSASTEVKEEVATAIPSTEVASSSTSIKNCPVAEFFHVKSENKCPESEQLSSANENENIKKEDPEEDLTNRRIRTIQIMTRLQQLIAENCIPTEEILAEIERRLA